MIEELNKLSKNDLKKFESFINSPYHNSYSTLTKLFNYLKKSYPNITKNTIAGDNMSMAIYGKKKINPATLRKLISDFNSLLDKFLINETINSDDNSYNLILLKSYKKFEFDKRVLLLYRKNKNTGFKKFIDDKNYYSLISDYEKEYFYFFHSKNDIKLVNIFPSRIKYLDMNFIFEKLLNYFEEIVCEVYLTRNIPVERNFFPAIEGYILQHFNEIKLYHPLIYMYYLTVKFYDSYDIKYLHLMEKYKKANQKKFTERLNFEYETTFRNIYTKLRARRIGNMDYLDKKLFDTYDKLLFNNKNSPERIASYILVQLVTTGISLKKLNWVKKLIDVYGTNLNDTLSPDCYNICMARYYFSFGNYHEAIFYANKVSKKVAHYYYTTKIIILRCNYELKSDTGIETSFDSLKHYFLRNKKITAYDIKILKTFTSVFSKLLNIRKEPDKSIKQFKIQSLREYINNLEVILDSKKWFLNELDKMSKFNLLI